AIHPAGPGDVSFPLGPGRVGRGHRPPGWPSPVRNPDRARRMFSRRRNHGPQGAASPAPPERAGGEKEGAKGIRAEARNEPAARSSRLALWAWGRADPAGGAGVDVLLPIKRGASNVYAHPQFSDFLRRHRFVVLFVILLVFLVLMPIIHQLREALPPVTPPFLEGLALVFMLAGVVLSVSTGPTWKF